MGNSSIRRRMINDLSTHNMPNCSVIIDGSFYSYKGHRVYVKLAESRDSDGSFELVFYTNEKDSGTGNKRAEVPNALERIKTMLSRSNIGDVDLPTSSNPDNAKIIICDDMHIMILQSELYSYVKEFLNRTDGNSIYFGDDWIDPSTVTKLCQNFIRESYTIYGDLIFGRNSKFTNRFDKRTRLYKVQSAFIPVFVNFEHVYNPLNEDNKEVTRTKLYQVAKEKNRFIQNYSMSCYLLTHLEICKALGMHEFMRFTPAVLYQVFVGLLHPNYPEFPNSNVKVMVRMEPSAGKSRFKNKYNKVAFDKEVAKISEQYYSETDMDKKAQLEREVAELQTFEEQDSLFVMCLDNQTQLRNIGSSILDRREDVTPAKLRGYLSSAKLLYADN